MIYIGSERWESKKGNLGYNIYIMDEVDKTKGVGNKPKMVFQNGFSRIPSTDADHYNDIFRSMKPGQTINELYFNERGYVVGCQLPK